MGRDCDALCIVGLRELFANYGGGLTDHTGNAVDVIGVIGREFLRHAKMTYNGVSGQLEIELELGAMQHQGSFVLPARGAVG